MGSLLVHCLAALSVNGDLPFASLAASRVLPISSSVLLTVRCAPPLGLKNRLTSSYSKG
nr:hypothetical protein [Providencia rettgeri]